MVLIFIWVVLFSLATAISVLLMGSRDIIGPDFTLKHIFGLLTHWKFITGLAFALFARFLFLLINSSIYNIPHLAQSSTTITFLATTISIFIVLLGNYFFLGEQLNFMQSIGAVCIIVGIFFLFK